VISVPGDAGAPTRGPARRTASRRESDGDAAAAPQPTRRKGGRRVSGGARARAGGATALPLASLLLASLLQAALAAAVRGQEAAPHAVVYLVRHAERAEDHPTDPSLSERGRERAELLARTLADAGVAHIHSTPLRRTRATAAPLAARLGLGVQEYAAAEGRALAERIRGASGRHLVVGHSNTLPELVRALGGDPGAPIQDATEYDRLYVLVVARDGTVTTSLLRYGPPDG
jgi:phosphohistidine phosphatase SixA